MINFEMKASDRQRNKFVKIQTAAVRNENSLCQVFNTVPGRSVVVAVVY